MNLNAATCTDGYKLSHASMYADGTNKVYNNLTPRSDRIYRANSATKFYDGRLVWIGAQGAVQEVKEMWDDFFRSDKETVVNKFARRMAGYLGGFDPAVKVIGELHDVGYLPLQIKSLPEGVKVKFGTPVLTVTNTLPQFYWLVNYLETVISALTWKPATAATIAAEYKAICEYYAELTGTDAFTVSIQCHDFSMRGMSGPEDSARTGLGHLTQFIGTDSLPAMDYAEAYYDADPDSLIAISVPATEHAVATSNILYLEENMCDGGYVLNSRLAAETMFMEDLITRKFPTGIVSYVADSFDFWAVLTEILPALKETILARQASAVAPGKLVIRPDSGDPVKVVCGYTWSGNVYTSEEELRTVTHSQYNNSWSDKGGWAKNCDIDKEVVNINGVFYKCHLDGHDFVKASMNDIVPECEVKGAIQLLWETFGGTVTDKGYKMLDSHIGLIYGDSITTKRAEEILRRLMDKGFASGNVVFGVGSYTYQCVTRDTFGFAIKATYTEVDGEGVVIFKDPKTDSKKKSARGLLFVGYNTDGGYVLEDDVTPEEEASEDNKLKEIFIDGEFTSRTSLEDIRIRLSK